MACDGSVNWPKLRQYWRGVAGGRRPVVRFNRRSEGHSRPPQINKQKGPRQMKRMLLPIAAGAVLALVAGAANATTLDSVKTKGFVQCGVNTGLLGFGAPDDKGNWTGFDVDYCRAVAAAVLGSGAKVKYTALSAKERFTALQSGEVDILSRNTTWTITRDAGLGLVFAGVIYYDGQGFMVRRSRNTNSALDRRWSRRSRLQMSARMGVGFVPVFLK